jgi:hypothetical protein
MVGSFGRSASACSKRATAAEHRFATTQPRVPGHRRSFETLRLLREQAPRPAQSLGEPPGRCVGRAALITASGAFRLGSPALRRRLRHAASGRILFADLLWSPSRRSRRPCCPRRPRGGEAGECASRSIDGQRLNSAFASAVLPVRASTAPGSRGTMPPRDAPAASACAREPAPSSREQILTERAGSRRILPIELRTRSPDGGCTMPVAFDAGELRRFRPRCGHLAQV